jgi:hypothetical protein
VALRTFVDAMGDEWEAFDVIPRAEERRAYNRRSAGQTQAMADAERREHDRRITVGGRSNLVGNLNQGWLCFERGSDRRRLTPIPSDWQRCSDEELSAYRDSARPVRLNSTSLQQLSDREH